MKKKLLEIILSSVIASCFFIFLYACNGKPGCVICITMFTDRTEYVALKHHYKNFHNHKSRTFYLCHMCNFTANASNIKYHFAVKHRKELRLAQRFDRVHIPHLPQEYTSEKEMRNYSARLYSILEEAEKIAP